MPKVADFAEQLPESERVALANHIGAGLRSARLAAQCFTDPGPGTESVVQLLAFLSRAIRELEAARDEVRRHST